MIRVVVSTPTRVIHDGATYGAGEELDVATETARKWIAAGWVSPVSLEEADAQGLSGNLPERGSRMPRGARPRAAD
ncbi:MAG: hypothetical protein ABR529_07295 [Actinomycetota bacterium]